jgi:hypothetical protein
LKSLTEGREGKLVTDLIIELLNHYPSIAKIEVVFYTEGLLDPQERVGGDRESIYSLQKHEAFKLLQHLRGLDFQRRAVGFRARARLESGEFVYFPILDIDAKISLEITRKIGLIRYKLDQLFCPGWLIFSGQGFHFLGNTPMSLSEMLEFQSQAVDVFAPKVLRESEFYWVKQGLEELAVASSTMSFKDVGDQLTALGRQLIEAFPLGPDLVLDSPEAWCLLDLGQLAFSLLDESLGVIRISKLSCERLFLVALCVQGGLKTP